MNRSEIEKSLIGNGHLINESRRKGKSLSRMDRAIIGRVRQSAVDAGISRLSINALEMEGELGLRGTMATPVEAIYKGIQEFSWIRGFRLYDIRGDHPQNNSTVGIMTLVHEGIFPKDINVARVAFEYLNECAFLFYCWTDSRYQDLKRKCAAIFYDRH